MVNTFYSTRGALAMMLINGLTNRLVLDYLLTTLYPLTGAVRGRVGEKLYKSTTK